MPPPRSAAVHLSTATLASAPRSCGRNSRRCPIVKSLRGRTAGALAGAFGSAALINLVQGHTPMHGYLFAAVGILSCVVIGYVFSLVTPPPRRQLVPRPPQPAAAVSES